MAATAYAFLVSLTNTMDSIQIHPRLSTCFDHHHFQSLRKNLDSLLHFVENHSDDSVMDERSSDTEDLLNRIATVAQKAEDIIEVEAADQIRDVSTTEKSQSFLLDLQSTIQEIDSIINKEVIKLKVERPLQVDLLPTSPPHVAPPSSSLTSAPPATVKKSSMVGFDGYIEQLLNELTGHHSGRRILPIVGMGGVGKTTLARSVYENLLTVEHFVVRVWVTVSQTFTVSDIFLQALSCLGGSPREKDSTTDDELGEELHKNLYGRRYMIVLDDMWSVEAWERIKFYFPENNNGSRIVVTTRQQQLVDYFASSTVAVGLLDDKNSWELFCDKVFGHHEQGGCPHELQQVGDKIVKRCKGLPLAITVIGGLLGKSPRTQDYWEKIAKDRSLVLEYSSGTNDNNNPLSILYTSYKHLPVCLKSCFLYLGLFPEDDQIDVSILIKFWIAEGFLKPNRKQSLEEVAESCIKELVDRNLLLVGNLRVNKKIETCNVHDLVRELSIRIAEKENFYCVQRDIGGKRELIVDERTASFYPSESLTSISYWEKPISVYHPLEFGGQNGEPFKSRLQRVMVHPIDAHCEEVNLRFMYDISYQSPPRLPDLTLSLFWSLQSIIFHPSSIDVAVTVEIWKMPQLRHIEISTMHLPDPPTSTSMGNEDVVVLHNLQTLKNVENLRLSEEVCKRIPNVKELCISYILNETDDLGDSSYFQLHNLKKLESLQCYFFTEKPLQILKLPNSLKELSLGSCCLAWSDLEMLTGALPHLQILELQENAGVGAEWNLGVEVEFISLKHLKFDFCDQLITWIADASNFPVLETVDFSGLSELEEIPAGIGEIRTLEKIHVYCCSESATKSAIQILEEQVNNGNDDLQLRLKFISKDEAQIWREQIQELGITSQNLHIFGIN